MHSRDIRQLHAAQVFYALMIEPDISQQDLCDRTGCDKSTVSLIVKRFEDLNVVVRRERVKSGQRGRPKERLHIVEDAGLLVGIHLEFGSLRFTASGIGGLPLKTHDYKLPISDDRIGDAIIAGLHEFCALIGKSADAILCVGISVPGQVDNNGLLLNSPNLGWQNVDIGAQIGGRLKAPFIIDNDTKAAALAEHFFGVARGVNDFLLISGGIGVGGAFFLDGDVYRGANGYAGEIGHSKVVRNGRLCHCGSVGCLAAYLTSSALIERAKLIDPSIETIDRIVELARAGSEDLLALLGESGELLGLAVSNMINALNVPMVIPGGHFVELWSFMKQGFNEALTRYSLGAPLSGVEIRLSTISTHPFQLGGTALALSGLVNLVTPAEAPWSTPRSERRVAH